MIVLSTSFRQYFYPRPPRGGRHTRIFPLLLFLHISIHALREEGDCAASCILFQQLLFLSTPSARRATNKAGSLSYQVGEFLSTPSARRATKFFFDFSREFLISIHALREEGDISGVYVFVFFF